MRDEIKLYASGDGALSFTKLRGGCAIGSPTLAEAEHHFLKSDDARHLRENKYRFVIIHGQPFVVADVSRIDENHLFVDGGVYRYEMDPNDIFWTRDKHARSSSVHLFCPIKLEGWESPQEMESINQSSKSAAAHFLNHEKELTPTTRPLEDKTLQAAQYAATVELSGNAD